MTDRRRWTDDEPWLYYQLTNEPKGSAELKIMYMNILADMCVSGSKIEITCLIKPTQIIELSSRSNYHYRSPRLLNTLTQSTVTILSFQTDRPGQTV